MTDQATTWNNLLLRLQTCAYRECRGHALSIVTVKLLVRDGGLARWSRPVVTYTEPAGGDGGDMPDDLLTDEALENLTQG